MNSSAGIVPSPALHLCENTSEGARTDPAIRAMEHRSPVRRQFCQPGVLPALRVRKAPAGGCFTFDLKTRDYAPHLVLAGAPIQRKPAGRRSGRGQVSGFGGCRFRRALLEGAPFWVIPPASQPLSSFAVGLRSVRDEMAARTTKASKKIELTAPFSVAKHLNVGN